jgi:hypothetical protein
MNKSDETSMGKRKELAENFFQYYHLLWRIAYSNCLAQHLLILEAARFLHLPTGDDKEAYQTYTAFAPPKKLKEKPGELEDDDELGDELRRAQRDLSMLTTATIGRAKYFEGWLRVLVAHVGALDIISEFCCFAPQQDISISLISVKSPPSRGTSIGDWRATVRSLTTRATSSGPVTVFAAEDAIEQLERLINLPEFDDCGIIRAFRLEIVKVGGTEHCEAVLSMLAKHFRDNPSISGELADLMKARGNNLTLITS